MIIETDRHFYEGGRYVWSAQRRRAAWEACVRLFREALEGARVEQVVMMVGMPGSGKSTCARTMDRDGVVVLDSTFVEPERRRQILQIARQFGTPVVAVWVDTEWEVCVRRNAERAEDRRVPVEVMRGMHQRLHDNRPREEEGFAVVRRVCTGSETIGGNAGAMRKAG